MSKVLHQVLLDRAKLVSPQHLWDGYCAGIGQLLDGHVAQLVICFTLLLRSNFLLDIFLEVINRSKWPNLRRKLISQLRQRHFLDLLDGRIKDNCLPS